MNPLKHLLVCALVTLTLAPPQANAVPVDLEIALLIDVSPSVDTTEFNLQMSGYQSAFQDASIQAAIAALPGGIAANVIFFSQDAVQKVPWTHLTGAVSANAFAGLFPGLSRTPPVNSGTDLAEGYTLAANSFAGNGFEGSRLVIDISGDGPQNLNGGCPGLGNGTDPACLAQTNAARALAELNGIVANGIVIDDALFAPNTGVGYYQDNIITSTGFAVAAADFASLTPVLRNKILRELVGVPEPVTIALFAVGLAGLAISRRRRVDA